MKPSQTKATGMNTKVKFSRTIHPDCPRSCHRFTQVASMNHMKAMVEALRTNEANGIPSGLAPTQAIGKAAIKARRLHATVLTQNPSRLIRPSKDQRSEEHTSELQSLRH